MMEYIIYFLCCECCKFKFDNDDALAIRTAIASVIHEERSINPGKTTSEFVADYDFNHKVNLNNFPIHSCLKISIYDWFILHQTDIWQRSRMHERVLEGVHSPCVSKCKVTKFVQEAEEYMKGEFDRSV